MTRPRTRRVETAATPLDTYFREIDQTPLLSAQQEKELAYRIGEGDVAARDNMIRANLRLVVNLARSYMGKGLDLQDLIEEGNLGLLRAIEGFDPSMNTRFSTYASYWIKQSIRRALVNSAKTIRIPAYVVELMGKWRRTTAQLQDKLGRPPTSDEVARALGLARRKRVVVEKAIRVYTQTATESADVDLTLDDIVSDGRTKAPDAEMAETDDRQRLLELLGKMDQREAAVLRMRFGLGDEEPLTLKEIGERLGLTRERVRQIEGAALSRLSESLLANQVRWPVMSAP
jgi:RNA polymerase primary sigma factor